MRRMNGDGGAVAVLVAILALVLIGMSALVIDAGAFYQERRELQNGADAAALAVAAECSAATCTDPEGTAGLYADGNAEDDLATVDQVCGRPAPLALCPTNPAGVGSLDYVHVRTLTLQDGGGDADEVPWLFGQLLATDDDGTAGTTVGAQATVVWGAPGGLNSAIPVTFSACEWNKMTSNGTDLAPAPDYEAHPQYGYSTAWLKGAGEAYERVFYTHDASSAVKGAPTACPATPPGGDAPGSFGWLSDSGTGGDGGCTAETTLSPDGEPGYANQPGNTVPSVCKKGDFPQPGEIVYVPVYDYFTAGAAVVDGKGNPAGQHVWYHVEGYAAFYVTGYNLQLPGGDDKSSIVTGLPPCKGSARCFSGFFTSGLAPASGPVTSGPSYGANVTQLVG